MTFHSTETKILVSEMRELHFIFVNFTFRLNDPFFVANIKLIFASDIFNSFRSKYK